jgi:(p)ppGpp synthase/HD superfamily hydrolase
LREAQQLGQMIEIVLHPLNPDEVIGIVFPERHLAIWQGNPENLKDQGLDRPFSEKLIETLISWQTHRSQLKGIYMATVNFERLDSYRETVLNQILCDLQTKV